MKVPTRKPLPLLGPHPSPGQLGLPIYYKLKAITPLGPKDPRHHQVKISTTSFPSWSRTILVSSQLPYVQLISSSQLRVWITEEITVLHSHPLAPPPTHPVPFLVSKSSLSLPDQPHWCLAFYLYLSFLEGYGTKISIFISCQPSNLLVWRANIINEFKHHSNLSLFISITSFQNPPPP